MWRATRTTNYVRHLVESACFRPASSLTIANVHRQELGVLRFSPEQPRMDAGVPGLSPQPSSCSCSCLQGGGHCGHEGGGARVCQAAGSSAMDGASTGLQWRCVPQAHTLGEQTQASKLAVDVVVVSPMMRALETAVGVFGAEPLGAGEAGPLLMVAQEELEGKRAAHAAVSTRGVPPFVACELCRCQAPHTTQHRAAPLHSRAISPSSPCPGRPSLLSCLLAGSWGSRPLHVGCARRSLPATPCHPVQLLMPGSSATARQVVL
jgi:hypothetical protein